MHTHPSFFSDDDRAPARPALNRLLSSLADDDQGKLLALCDTVRVDVGEVLYEPGQAIRHVYFPVDSLISLLAVAEGRMTLEVGSVGQEGMIGASVALGHELALVRAVVQRAGRASRIAVADFRAEFKRNEALQRLLYRYTDTLLAQAIQIAVCSRFHVLEARLARTLLITRDRLQSEKFHLTHEFLAHALGVRRVGVTKAASALQQQKLISYSRGNIEILDSTGLEAASCRCYELVKDKGAMGMAKVFL
ncbi:Crp/Fnr family transcriptional regulator [Duganella sp. BJB488]|uniref:Crp/Fnr family transcriptional regulator n=1 Tax=unclassified Duganella TaxID=2636909 RepID=UPI000E344188|nr:MULTISPECIES: Crp/Fnr family transcriptional regulator [unclassified Duganella]RFP08726.1 Crp/Fnr family transcriptional regulator [Duganella sp. BJB489]RFP11519.1 Crp/Fnr family transcriptional regulator [Duganella sp. BJB488]RFP38038.1 Crp/Fnr family transcriptional regulator [Duganella sp. BJB480]